MKNKLTRIICSIVICFALLFGFVPAAVKTVYAEESTPAVSGETKQLKGIASSKQQGETLDVYDVAGLEKGSDKDYTIVVKNPRGVDITSSVAGEKLLLEEIGVYTVTYNFNDATKTSYTYQVKVSGSYASLSFETNTKAILPEKIKSTFAGKVYLPMPKVLDAEGKEFDAEAGLKVSVAVNKATATHKNIEITATTTQEDLYFNLDSEYAGDYVITYKVKDANGYTLTTQTYTVNAGSNVDANYDFTAKFATTAPTTAVVGVAQTLPLIEAVNSKTNNTVSHYYTIKAVFVNEAKEEVDVTNDVISNNNVFTANKPGDYKLAYTVYDVYGNVVTKDLTFSIKEVKDSQTPTVLVVDPYTYTETEVPTTTNAVNKLPSVWGKTDIVLPAIFAEDNYSKLHGDFTFTRYIMNSSGDTVLSVEGHANKALVINSTGSANLSTPEYVNVTSLEGYENLQLATGSYKVYYKAVDKAGKQREQYYTMKIQNDFFDDETPTVNYSNTSFPSTIVAGETFTFSAPVVTDDNDTRIDVVVRYSLGEFDGNSNEIYYTLKADENNKYSITLPKDITDKKVLKIVTTATDDRGYATGTSTVVEKTMTIRNIKDTVVPTLVSVDSLVGLNDFVDQKDKVYLPEITYSDDHISNLNVNIYVSYQKDGKTQYVNVYDKKETKTKSGDNGTTSIHGAYFYADRITDYTITYVAKDAGNNVVLKSYVYSKNNIVATVAPKLEGLTNLPTALTTETLELGEKITLPKPVVRDSNGDEIADAAYTVEVTSGPANYEFEYDYTYFKPTSVGIYYLQYVVQVEGKTLTSKEYKVEVSDKTKPTINVSQKVDMPKTLEKGATASIPTFSVEDASELNTDECYIKITSPKTATRTITYDAAETAYSYTFAENTSYTITYYAEDIYGNSSSRSFTVKVGDVEAPTLELAKNSKCVPASEYVIGSNDTFTLTLEDLEDFTIYDAIDKNLSKEDIIVTVTNTTTNQKQENLDENASTKSWKYKFTTVGSYTISFSIKDEAGNTSEALTYNFTVKDAASGSSVDVTKAVSVVLIVLAVAIIAGVVVYFVLSQRKINKIKKNIKK